MGYWRDALDGSEALMRVTLHALEHCDFRQAWDAAVRDGADVVTARIAGARMAGETGGNVAWNARVPCPHGMDPDDAERAYRQAVRAEAARRLNAMAPERGGAG